jgi:hypothetical protein
VGSVDRVLEVQAVGEKLLDSGRQDDYAGGVAGFEDVEGEEDGVEEFLTRMFSCWRETWLNDDASSEVGCSYFLFRVLLYT